MPTADTPAPMASDHQRANALLKAGRLYHLIGLTPGVSRREVKAACRAAQLRCHPDKGGSAEVFQVVDAACQLLLNEMPRFDGPPPAPVTELIAKIEQRRQDIDNWEAQLAGLQSTMARARTDHERAAVQKSQKMAELMLAGDVKELASSREEYTKLHREHAREQEEAAARAKELMERARWRMVQASREKDALRKRCSRKQSTRFPTLPRVDVGSIRRAYANIRTKFRELSKTRSRYSRNGMDATSLDRQLEELLNQARAIVDAAVASKCEARGLHKTFPRLARSHPKYDCLAPLRKAHRRLWDRLRRAGAREDLEAMDAEILRQAWELVQSYGDATPMSVEADPIDTVVR